MPGCARGLVLGYALDLCLGDPRRHHPVALCGRVALVLERSLHADSRVRGALHWVLCVGGPMSTVLLVRRRDGVLLTALVTWSVLGQRSLVREGRGLAAALEQPTLAEARRRLPALCGRDPDALDRPGLCRAGVESLAENTSDAVVAPLLWGSVLGVPGMVGYRLVNTLDAMVGHRSDRYRRFGAVAARADDLANLLPARLTAALTCLVAQVVGGSPRHALTTWRRDGARHPSPNAGQCEAAAAGALGVRLGGTNVYPSGAEQRPHLGDGREPLPGDVRRAATLSGVVGALALATAVTVAALLGRRR